MFSINGDVDLALPFGNENLIRVYIDPLLWGRKLILCISSARKDVLFLVLNCVGDTRDT